MTLAWCDSECRGLERTVVGVALQVRGPAAVSPAASFAATAASSTAAAAAVAAIGVGIGRCAGRSL